MTVVAWPEPVRRGPAVSTVQARGLTQAQVRERVPFSSARKWSGVTFARNGT